MLSVRPADYPIVVLLDNGSEARADFPLMQKAAAHFIDRIGQRPIALGTFGGAPKHAHDLRGRAADGAGEAGRDRGGDVRRAARCCRARRWRPARFSATGTLFSCVVILSATAADASSDPQDEMIAPIVDSNATLHVIANRPGQTAAGGQRASPTLRALAEQSRGEFTVVYSAASYQAALDRLADRLTSEMMIEYLVPVGSKPNDVKVGVRIIGAKVRGLGVAPR